MAEFRPGTPDQTAAAGGLDRRRAPDPVRRPRRLRPRQRLRGRPDALRRLRDARGDRRRRDAGGPALPAGAAAQADRGARLPGELPAPGRHASSPSRATRLEARAMAERAGAHEDWSEHQRMTDLVPDAGRLLPGLPGDRRARPAAGRRRDDRPGRLLRLPPRALRRPGAAADVPHARAGPDRRARGRADVARRLARPRAGAAARRSAWTRGFDVATDPFFGRAAG